MDTKITVFALARDIEQQLFAVYADPMLSEQYAWWMLETILRKTPAQLIADQTIALTEEQRNTIQHWLDQMINEHMPIQYLIGSVPFHDVEILVEPPVLIPRPETEEWTINLINQLTQLHPAHFTIADLCAGSGCIAIALGRSLKGSTIYAIDNAPHAIALTKKNSIHNQLQNVIVMSSDLFEAIPDDVRFDLIVSNPPYIARDAWQNLDLSVTTWEDPHALIAEDHGLALIKKIIHEAPRFLKRNAPLAEKKLPNLMLEIGFDQGEAVAQLFAQAGYSNIRIHKDLEGKDRVVSGRIEDVAITNHTE